ncbi:MAG: class I SAM-dependent methyltransferase [Pseudomonadota bacterium]
MMIRQVDECYKEVMSNLEKKIWPSRFEPNDKLWYPHLDERCVEIPWALSRYQGQKKILEIGLALADLMLVKAQIQLKQLGEAKLYALDIVEIDRVLNRFDKLDVNIRGLYHFTQGDARNSLLNDNSFDLIFLISTLEHIGFDEFEPDKSLETVFKRPSEYPDKFPDYNDCHEDRKALTEIKRILSPGGSLLLTVPFGKRGICISKDSKGLWAFYKEYSLTAWRKLVEESGLLMVDERFFFYDDRKGWIESTVPEDLCKIECSIEAPVKCVVCAELKKG